MQSRACCVSEWSYSTGKPYGNPFDEVVLDVVVTAPDGGVMPGGVQVVPAYWAEGGVWRVRYAPDTPGQHKIHTVCSDTDNDELHDVPRQATGHHHCRRAGMMAGAAARPPAGLVTGDRGPNPALTLEGDPRHDYATSLAVP